MFLYVRIVNSRSAVCVKIKHRPGETLRDGCIGIKFYFCLSSSSIVPTSPSSKPALSAI